MKINEKEIVRPGAPIDEETLLDILKKSKKDVLISYDDVRKKIGFKKKKK